MSEHKDMAKDKTHLGMVVVGHVDAGKCFESGTTVRMFDGSVQTVETLEVGDVLMGDDSTPRTIMGTTSGEAMMYDIVPTKGNSFTCNGDHVLTLKLTNPSGLFYDKNRNRYRIRWMSQTPLKLQEKIFAVYNGETQEEVYMKAKEYLDNKLTEPNVLKYKDVIDIELNDFMKLNTNTKSYFKLFHNGVEYPTQSVAIDPYFFGLWLGDGDSNSTRITNGDPEVYEYLVDYCKTNDMKLTPVTDIGFYIGTTATGKRSNPFLNFLTDQSLIGNKHIPNQYMVNDRQTRLNLLAGLLDTDGYYENGYYEITSKFKLLAEQIKTLALSLGFMATLHSTMKKSQTMNEKREYYRVNIMGSNLDEIPCIVERRIANPRMSAKDPTMYGFRVFEKGVGPYDGFELDENGRFLLEDFTVSHNSTTTGHLLFELGGISQRDMDKLKAEADALGKSSFMYAFFTDKQKDEQARGITISCTTKEFFTDTKHFTLIDAPGHKDFIKNMIRGASQADVALLMVPASGFEEAIAKADRKKQQVEGQTRQHAMLCNLLGIQQLIVGVNKMDDPSVKYSETRFNEIRDEVTRMLKGVGWANKLADPKKDKALGEIPIIPMSGWTGENLTKPSENMPWYKGFHVKIDGKEIKGHTLIDALENVVQLPKRPVDKELCMPISGLLKIGGVGDVITGRIEQGSLKVDDKVCFAPSGIKGRVFSIEMHHRQVPEAGPGDNVGVNIKGLSKDASGKPKEGNIMLIDKGDDKIVVESFRVAVMVQEHPGQLKASKDGKGGFTPMVMVRTAKVAAQLSKIHWKKGKTSTGNVKVENAEFVEKGDAAEVTFVPKQPIYLNKFSECPGLGRVAVMDSNCLVMLGKVVDVTYKKLK